jgi:folylpolyglutamate synthase/dihydropteroate synthase
MRAHNPAGAEALASYLKDLRRLDTDKGGERLPIVFAAMADKDLKNMIAPLADLASAFFRDDDPVRAGARRGSTRE